MKPDVHQRLQQAIDRIESGLREPLSLSEIADSAHLSAHHFARLFRSAFGDSVMNYVRRRRLNLAVDLLGNHCHSILQIAVECGFGSNEAFTRAFKKQYGLSPLSYRRNRPMIHLPTHRSFTVNDLAAPVDIKPSLESRDSFFAVGCADEFQPGATQDIGRLWGRFAPRMAEVGNRVGAATYGMCLLPEEGERDPERFTYVAAVEVSGLEDVPEGMTGVEIPARTYAVFTYSGGLGPNLPKTMQFIFGDWLPNSDYELDGVDFEYYDDRFDPETGTGTFYIYVPVKESRV